MSKKLILATILILLSNSVFCQEIRTFNTVNFSTNYSKRLSSYSISVGEMLQVKKSVPFRILIAAQYSAEITQQGTWLSNTLIKFPHKIFTSNFNIPLGAEVFYKSIGLGFVKEIINFNVSKSFDSTKIQSTKNYEVRTNGFSHLFSNKNNLNSTLYLVYTLNDSFSLKLGVNRGNEVFNFYENSKKVGFSKLSENSVFLSFRTNIEK